MKERYIECFIPLFLLLCLSTIMYITYIITQWNAYIGLASMIIIPLSILGCLVICSEEHDNQENKQEKRDNSITIKVNNNLPPKYEEVFISDCIRSCPAPPSYSYLQATPSAPSYDEIV